MPCPNNVPTNPICHYAISIESSGAQVQQHTGTTSNNDNNNNNNASINLLVHQPVMTRSEGALGVMLPLDTVILHQCCTVVILHQCCNIAAAARSGKLPLLKGGVDRLKLLDCNCSAALSAQNPLSHACPPIN